MSDRRHVNVDRNDWQRTLMNNLVIVVLIMALLLAVAELVIRLRLKRKADTRSLSDRVEAQTHRSESR